MKNVLFALVTLSSLSFATPAAAECRRLYLATYSMIDQGSDGVISNSESVEAKANVDYFAQHPSEWASFGANFASYFLKWDFDHNGKLDAQDQALYNLVMARKTGCSQTMLSVHSQVDGFATLAGQSKDGHVAPIDLMNGYNKIYQAVLTYMNLPQ